MTNEDGTATISRYAFTRRYPTKGLFLYWKEFYNLFSYAKATDTITFNPILTDAEWTRVILENEGWRNLVY